MTMEPFPNRRKLRSVWDELNYLYFKAGYWMYERGRCARARPLIKRVRGLLSKHRITDDSIPAVEAKGLVADFEGDLRKEIYYKELEIAHLRKLLSCTTEIDGYTWSTLLSEMSLLATLLEEDSRRAEALKKVDECIRFARKHRIKFDGGQQRKLIWRASP